jgi:hypothetical protein
MDTLEYNPSLGNGKERVPMLQGPEKESLYEPMSQGTGLGNTNPIAAWGLTFSFIPRRHRLKTADLPVSSPTLGTPTLQGEAVLSAEGRMGADAQVLPKPPGRIILFRKIIQDWGFSDQEAATLLGFEEAADVKEIYLGTKPLEHRDANDRLRAVLRIAADLDTLFEEVAVIRDWLNEAQHDLSRSTPRSLLTEGSMEKLLSVKYFVAYLSGR